MATTAQHLLGQLLDGRFPLRKLLGVSSNSAVFLTDLPNSRPSEPAPEAAIKLIPEDPDSSDQQLERWRATSVLSHPGLLRILHFGRCAVDGSPCLYVVTELASENLGELLAKRPLPPDDTTSMMAPVLVTLDFLHEKGLVHAGLKPSNILAVRDVIKLSPDRILPAGESSPSWPLAAPYAAPESLLSPASDIWSLGITLYETLTQYLPNRESSGRYVLPQLPAPFSEIVRGALVEDAAQRVTLDDIRSLVDPTFVPKPKPAPLQAAALQPPEPVPTTAEAHAAAPQPLAAAAQAAAAPARPPEPATLPEVDPLSVPLSPVSPRASSDASPQQPPARIPVSSLPNVNASIGAPRRIPAAQKPAGTFKFFAIGAGATLLLAILILPRVLRNSAEPSTPSSAPKSVSTNPPASARPASAPPAAAPSKSAANGAPAPTKTPADSAPRRGDAEPKPGATPPSTTSAASSAPSAATKVGAPPRRSADSGPGSETPEVTHQVIPEVSQKARATIRGTVRINVRVQLNPDGSVSSAGLDSPAPSQFFANLALDAARQWRFAPSAASSALVRFDFTNAMTTATVASSNPQ